MSVNKGGYTDTRVQYAPTHEAPLAIKRREQWRGDALEVPLTWLRTLSQPCRDCLADLHRLLQTVAPVHDRSTQLAHKLGSVVALAIHNVAGDFVPRLFALSWISV